MKILKTAIAALMITGLGLVATETYAQEAKQEVATTNKAQLEAAFKDFHSSTARNEAETYEQFLNKLYPVLSAQKAAVAESGESPAEFSKYEKLVNSFNKIIQIRRDNDKAKLEESMKSFIALVEN